MTAKRLNTARTISYFFSFILFSPLVFPVLFLPLKARSASSTGRFPRAINGFRVSSCRLPTCAKPTRRYRKPVPPGQWPHIQRSWPIVFSARTRKERGRLLIDKFAFYQFVKLFYFPVQVVQLRFHAFHGWGFRDGFMSAHPAEKREQKQTNHYYLSHFIISIALFINFCVFSNPLLMLSVFFPISSTLLSIFRSISGIMLRLTCLIISSE